MPGTEPAPQTPGDWRQTWSVRARRPHFEVDRLRGRRFDDDARRVLREELEVSGSAAGQRCPFLWQGNGQVAARTDPVERIPSVGTRFSHPGCSRTLVPEGWIFAEDEDGGLDWRARGGPRDAAQGRGAPGHDDIDIGRPGRELCRHLGDVAS